MNCVFSISKMIQIRFKKTKMYQLIKIETKLIVHKRRMSAKEMKLKFQKHHLEVSSMQEYPRVQCQGSRVCALTRWGTWMIPWKISMILPQWLVEACKPYSQSTKELWNYYTSDNGEVFKVIHSRWQTFKILLQCKVSQTVDNNKWWCLELAPWATKWLESVLSKN